MKWYRLYKESSDSDFKIENGVLLKYLGKGGKVVIPKGVTSIGVQAFYMCKSLTSVTIPNSVTSIKKFAFLDCIGLTNVTIPDSVTSIGFQAFYGCSSLTSVTIGNGVTNIEKGTFWGCGKLETVNLPPKLPIIDSGAFSDCPFEQSKEWQTIKFEQFIKQFNGMDGITKAYVSTKGIPCIKISTWDVELPDCYVDFKYTVKCRRTTNDSYEKWIPIEPNALSKAVESVIGRFPFATENTPNDVEKLIFVLDFTDYN